MSVHMRPSTERQFTSLPHAAHRVYTAHTAPATSSTQSACSAACCGWRAIASHSSSSSPHLCTRTCKHAHTQTRTYAQMHRCTDAQMHRCTDAQMHITPHRLSRLRAGSCRSAAPAASPAKALHASAARSAHAPCRRSVAQRRSAPPACQRGGASTRHHALHGMHKGNAHLEKCDALGIGGLNQRAQPRAAGALRCRREITGKRE
eukprot:scaffold71210_cov78-Phaeocystis_antarctica.AAC.5